MGCFASCDDWIPGDPLECEEARVEVCGLRIPCEALEGPTEFIDDGHPSRDPVWKGEHRVGAIHAAVDPRCTEPESDCQALPVQVTLRQSDDPLTVTMSRRLSVVHVENDPASAVELVDYGFRAQAVIHPNIVVYPPDQGLFFRFGGCSCSHGRGLCGSHGPKRTKLPARVRRGAPLYVWAHVTEPFDVVFSLVRPAGSRVLRGRRSVGDMRKQRYLPVHLSAEGPPSRFGGGGDCAGDALRFCGTVVEGSTGGPVTLSAFVQQRPHILLDQLRRQAEDAVAEAHERDISPRVSRTKPGVVRAIHFHHESRYRRDEVSDEAPEDHLPAKATPSRESRSCCQSSASEPVAAWRMSWARSAQEPGALGALTSGVRRE